jgi:probable HAF family extracellular repeat protein
MKPVRAFCPLALAMAALALAAPAKAQYTFTSLGTIGGFASWAAGVNNAGQVTGYSTVITDSSHIHAFYWDGSMQDLGTLGGFYSEAYRMNGAGRVVGHATGPGEPSTRGWV